MSGNVYLLKSSQLHTDTPDIHAHVSSHASCSTAASRTTTKETSSKGHECASSDCQSSSLLSVFSTVDTESLTAATHGWLALITSSTSLFMLHWAVVSRCPFNSCVTHYVAVQPLPSLQSLSSPAFYKNRPARRELTLFGCFLFTF